MEMKGKGSGMGENGYYNNGLGIMNEKSLSRNGGSQSRSVKELPGLLNRSVQLSHPPDGSMPIEEITLGHFPNMSPVTL